MSSGLINSSAISKLPVSPISEEFISVNIKQGRPRPAYLIFQLCQEQWKKMFNGVVFTKDGGQTHDD